MSHQNTSIANSMIDCAKTLQSQFSYGENFVFLTGVTGSGRTNMCEHVVNALESKFTTIFIPCQNQMSIEQLRQLFLQQIAPTEKWDENKPLTQSFNQLSIPVRQKLLVVIDDIDLVISSFFDEVLSLYEQNLGQNRFSFLVTSHPLWAQTKINSVINDKLKIKEIEVPKLSIDEALQICKQMFIFAGLEKIYNAILPKLPKAFEACEGNVSKVIKLTEIFMSDPIQTDNEAPVLNEQKKVPSPKKRNSTGIFISIVCIVIVLACLVPIFLGTNVVDKLLGKDADQTQSTKVEIDPNQAPGNELSFGDKKDDLKPTDDPLAVSAGAVTDIKAPDLKGTESKPAQDDGALLEKIEEGIVADDSKTTTKNSVTLEGETLDAIEGKEADAKSDDPRQGLAGSVEKKENNVDAKNDASTALKTAKDSSDEVVVLQRSNSALYKDKIQKEDEAVAAQLALNLEQKKQQEYEEQRARDLEQTQKAKAVTVLPSDKKASEVAKNTTVKANSNKTNRRASNRVNYRANPVPGATSELESKNSNHYTLQVLAGRDRGSLLRAADYVDGRYWIYTTNREGRPWYVLVTGDFASPASAVAEARRLPSNLRRAGPFAKTFDRVKTEMRMR